MSLTRKSQSALEYMMTYGWAILIIVIVAGVLYSFGIFNPSASSGTTITGFSGLGSPQALCMANGGLRLQLGNNLGQTINVTRINITSNGVTETVLPNQTISPQGTYIFYVPNVCGTSAGARYSFTSSVTYTEPGQVFPGPYFSSGKASGTVSSTNLPGEVPFFNGNAYMAAASVTGLPVGRSTRTVTAWFYGENVSPPGGYISDVFVYNVPAACNPDSMFQVYVGSSTVVMNAWCTNTNLGVILPNKWIFVSYSINGSSTPNGDTWQTGYIYNNGALNGPTTDGPYNISTPAVTGINIGSNYGANIYFDGYIANLQIYNFQLSQSQIQSLANEGIFGKPVTTSGLVAWYPLNGSLSSYLVSNGAVTNNGALFTSNYPAP